MPDLYGNPVVSGQMIPHGDEALTQNTQNITEQFLADAKYVQKKEIFDIPYDVLPTPTEAATVSQTSIKQTNPQGIVSRGFFCLGDSIS
jgi:hypothetical protein